MIYSLIQGDIVSIKDDCKDILLGHLLSGIQAQFESSELNVLQVKLASVASACYLSLLHHWVGYAMTVHLDTDWDFMDVFCFDWVSFIILWS